MAVNIGFTLALGFSLFSVYAVNTLLSSLLPSIQQDFAFTPLAAGLITSAYGWSYAAMQIPVGIMSDRIEPRKIIVFSMLLYALSTIWFSAANHETLLVASRIAMGFAASFVFVDGLKAIESYFDEKRIGKAIGLFTSIGITGIAVSNIVAPIVLQTSDAGWRSIYGAISLLPLAAGLLSIRLLPSRLLKRSSKIEQQPMGKRNIAQEVAVVTRNKYFWVQNIINLLYFGSIFGFFFWIPSYFQDKGLGLSLGGLAVSLISIGSIFGFPFAGWLIDRMGKRNAVLRIFLAIHTFLIAIVVFVQPAGLGFLILIPYFLLGLFWGGLTANVRLTAELFPKILVGTAMGAYNSASWVGSSLFPLLVGYLLTLGFTYQDSFLSILVAMLISLAISIFSYETAGRAGVKH